MASKTYYSWSTFPRSDVHPSEHIKVGQKVTASDFDSKEQFEELVNIGAIRAIPYPVPADSGFEGSPREYALAQVAEMEEAQYDASNINTWQVPQLQERAKAAMEETGHDETDADEEKAAEQDEAESKQGTRSVLGQAGPTATAGKGGK
jgi:hypothetical protein